MNEVNIMSGIDFKANQKRVRERIMKRKKEKKRWNTIVGVLVVILIIGLLFLGFASLFGLNTINNTKPANNKTNKIVININIFFFFIFLTSC